MLVKTSYSIPVYSASVSFSRLWPGQMETCTNRLEESKNNNSITFFSLTTEEKVSLGRGSVFFFLVLRLNGGVVKELTTDSKGWKLGPDCTTKTFCQWESGFLCLLYDGFCSNASLPRCCVIVAVFTAWPSMSLRTKRQQQTTRQNTDSEVFYAGLASNTAPDAAFDKQKPPKWEYEMTCRPNREKQTALLSDTSLQKGQA